MVKKKKVDKIFGVAVPKMPRGRRQKFAKGLLPDSKRPTGKPSDRVPAAPKQPTKKNAAVGTEIATKRDLVNEIAISERRAHVFDLARKSFTPRDIAKKLDITESLVRSDIKAELFALRQATINGVEAMRDLELARLDMVQKDLIPYCLTRLEVVPTKENPRNIVTIPPDHKKIETLLKIMERRAKYLGIDAPDKHLNVTIPWAKLNRDQIAKIAAGVDIKMVIMEVEQDEQKLLDEGDVIDITPADYDNADA